MISLPVHPSMIKRISVMSLFKDLQNFFHKEKQLSVTKIEPQAKAQNYPDAQPKKEVPQEEKKETPVGATVLRQESEPQIPDSHALPQEETNVKNSSGYNIGELIDNRYKIEFIMSGSMGYVYISKDTRQRITFAIKQPKNALLGDHELFARVVQEADAWTRLGMHPNIAYCYFVKAIAEVPHIFIEYVDGGSLEEWISDRRCADYQVGLDMAVQFCHGMERAHERGMIHRDIKPNNILVTQGGLVKVTDFGLVGGVKTSGSAGVEGDLHGTRMGDTMGTPAYMPPEQWNDPRQKSSEAPNGVWQESDVYSFGVCLWEMFCGKRPYELSIGVMGKPTETRELRRDIPDTLRELLLKSVELDRAKRQKNFGELKEDLNKVYQELYGRDAPSYQLELHDTTADELNNQGYSYYELGNMEKARRCFEDAINANSTNPEAVFNLSLIQWREGEIDDIEVLRRVNNCLSNPTNRKDKIVELLSLVHAERCDPALAKNILLEYPGRFDEIFGDTTLGSIDLKWSLMRQFCCVNSATLTPDGRYALLAGGEDNFIGRGIGGLELWDMKSGKHLRTIDSGIRDIITLLALSADGRYALCGGVYSLSLLEIESGKCLRIFDHESSYGRFLSGCFSADGRYVLSAGGSMLKAWGIESGNCIFSTELERNFHEAEISVSLSAEGRYALSKEKEQEGSGGGVMLKLWNIETGICLHTFAHFVSVCFSADGRYAFGRRYFGRYGFEAPSKRPELWDIETGKLLRIFDGDDTFSECIHVDAQYALSMTSDKTLQIWDVETGKCLQTLKGVGAPICFSPNNRYAVLKKNTQTLMLFEIKTGQSLHPFDGSDNKVKSLSFSADGKFVFGMVRQDFEERLKLWDVETGACVRTIKRNGHSSISKVCFGPNGRYALSAGGGDGDGSIKLWDIANGNCLRTLWGHKAHNRIHSVSLSNKGEYALSASEDNTLKCWDIETGNCLHTLDIEHLRAVSFSADGKLALSGGSYGDNVFKLWEIESGQCLRTFEGYGNACLSHDGKFIVLCTDQTLELLKIESGDCLYTLDIEHIRSVNFSVDGQYILSISYCNSQILKVLDTATGGCIRTIVRPDYLRTGLSFCTGGRYALSSGAEINITEDSGFKLWDIKTGKCHRTVYGWFDACLSKDGRYVLTWNPFEGTIGLWEIPKRNFFYHAKLQLSDLNTFEEIKKRQDYLRLSMQEVTQMIQVRKYSAAFALLYSKWEKADFYENNDLLKKYQELYSLSNNRILSFYYEKNVFTDNKYYMFYPCFTVDGKYVLTGIQGGMVKLWNVESGECFRSFDGHNMTVTSVCISVDNRYILSGDDEGMLKLWSVETGECLRYFSGHSNTVSSMCFSADGKYISTGCDDGTLKLWDVETGECLSDFVGHSERITCVIFSADCRYVLSGSYDQTLKLWDRESGQFLRVFEGHSLENRWWRGVLSVSFSANGQYVLSGSDDGTLKFWDRETGECLRSISIKHTISKSSGSPTTALCFSADGAYALSGRADDTHKLWDVNKGTCLQIAEGVGFNDGNHDVSFVSLSRDGRYALSIGYNCKIRLFRLIWKLEFDE